MDNQEFARLIMGVPTENVYVLTEKNANIIQALRLLPGNRPINPKKVEKLIEAFKENMYIPPILVSLPYRFVTEGNHRTKAALECIKLGIPFTLKMYMYKDDESLETARLINNTQDRWKANDRLHSYIHENKTPYVLLKQFMDSYPKHFKTKSGIYSIQAGLCVLANGRLRNSMQNAFNSGKLIITDDHVKHGHEIMAELEVIAEILNTTSVFARDHTTAWDTVRDRLGISFGKFIVKLRRRATNWEEPKDSVDAWFTMYMRIASGV